MRKLYAGQGTPWNTRNTMDIMDICTRVQKHVSCFEEQESQN